MNENIHAHMKQKDGYKFEVTFDELPGITIWTDEPAPEGKGEAPSAAMMLSAAVGHCLTSSLMFCIQKSRGEIQEIATDVETHLARNDKGRWRVAGIKVKLRPKVPEVDRQKLERCRGMFQDFCIVSASVREGVKIDVDVEL